MSTRRSLLYSYLDRYASLVLSIVSSMMIARLLTPTDIGVYSVSMVLLSFAATVRDMGAGGYLVQEKELTADRIRAVWAVQLGLGVGLGLLIVIASVPVALFYNEPRMTPIMLVVALTYMINPFGSLTYAWQMREMQFDRLALIRFASTLGGAVVSVALALKGVGPLSLALGTLGSTLLNAVLAIRFRPQHFPWLPGLKEVRRVLAFGSQTTGSSILQTLSGGSAELLLSKLQSLTETGLFSRAFGLVAIFDRLVLSAISSVATPWFAKRSRDDGDVADSFLRATAYVTAVGWAFSFTLVLLAFPAVRLLYGDQWDASVDCARILCIALALTVPGAMSVAALMAVGLVKRVFTINAVNAVVTIALSGIGAWGGLVPMAICFAVAALLRSVLWLRATQHALGFQWRDLFEVCWKSLIVGVAAAAPPTLVCLLVGLRPVDHLPLLALGVLGACTLFVASACLVRHPLVTEFERLPWPGFLTRTR